MFEELQVAIRNLLVTAVAPVAVYGAVPQGAAVPYLTLGEPEREARDTDTSLGALVRLTVRLVTRDGDVASRAELLDRILEATHHVDGLTLTRASVVSMYLEGPQGSPLTDEGKTRETEVAVCVLLDDITSGTA